MEEVSAMTEGGKAFQPEVVCVQEPIDLRGMLLQMCSENVK